MTQTQTPRSVVIYIRISKDRENETSTTTQEFEARAYAEQRGWEVVKVCTDPGRSAFKRGVKRPELEQALELVECGAANVLLVWKIDRFTRSVTDFWDYWSRIDSAGGSFASVQDAIDTTTAQGRMLLGIIASFAEMESAMKSERTKSWNDGRTREGAVPQGARPYGYNREANCLTINEAEAAIIRRSAHDLILGVGLKSLIKLYHPTSSRGGAMTARGLRSTLMNPTTAGYRRWSDGELVKGTWPAILPLETWEKVCTLLNDPERKTAPDNVRKHLLSGILTCGKPECEGAKVGARNWVKRSGIQAQRYQCTRCGNSIWSEDADKAISARMLDLVPQAEWDALRTQGRGYNPQVIQALEDEAESYLKIAGKGLMKPEQLEALLESVNERMASATGDEPLDLPAVENLAEGWEAMNLMDKRRVLKAVLSSVVLNPAQGVRGIARLQTERVA